MKRIDLWELSFSQFGKLTMRKWGKYPKNIMVQDDQRAKIYFTDGSVQTIFSWDFDEVNL